MRTVPLQNVCSKLIFNAWHCHGVWPPPVQPKNRMSIYNQQGVLILHEKVHSSSVSTFTIKYLAGLLNPDGAKYKCHVKILVKIVTHVN